LVLAFAPAISHDQLELIYAQAGSPVLRRATRATTADPWVDLAPIPELTAYAADSVTFAPDDLTIYFSGTTGATSDIFVASRPARDAPFGPASVVDELSDPAAADLDPDLSADGSTMVFASDRAGGSGKADIYIATRLCP
jgi:Tol biopolymer transport system component